MESDHGSEYPEGWYTLKPLPAYGRRLDARRRDLRARPTSRRHFGRDVKMERRRRTRRGTSPPVARDRASKPGFLWLCNQRNKPFPAYQGGRYAALFCRKFPISVCSPDHTRIYSNPDVYHGILCACVISGGFHWSGVSRNSTQGSTTPKTISSCTLLSVFGRSRDRTGARLCPLYLLCLLS